MDAPLEISITSTSLVIFINGMQTVTTFHIP